jgi:hypothetical protein
MKIINLTKETKQDILSSLLKRSPNNYDEYTLDKINSLKSKI